MIIEIHRVHLEDAPILRHLIELYLYDLSEAEGTDVDERGLFGYSRLDQYWGEPERHPFVVRVGGRIAGFVLVRELEPTDGSTSEPLHQIAEMFVLRRYRRRGVGRAVARRVFDMFCGRWEVRQHEANAPAQAFWRSVIGEYARGRHEEHRVACPEFSGVVQRFHSRTPQ